MQTGLWLFDGTSISSLIDGIRISVDHGFGLDYFSFDDFQEFWIYSNFLLAFAVNLAALLAAFKSPSVLIPSPFT